MSPQKCCGILEQREDTGAVPQETTFYCAGTDSVDSCPKTEPREQSALPYIPFQAQCRSEKQSLTHIWLSAIFIGYFTLSTI
jgi:hypothetical protein